MRIAAALLFSFLPGAWLTFGPRLPGFSFGARLMTGLVLTPVVLPAQLYLLRGLGLSFDSAVPLLVGLNLPVAWLAVRRSAARRFYRSDLLAVILLFAVCAASLAPQILDRNSRVYAGHGWAYADAAYLVANGDLDLDEPELAGVRLAYPWAGLVFQAVVSFLAGSTPVAAYIWVNLLWLFAVGALAASVVGVLGGGRLGKAAGVVALFFGVNFVGYVLLEGLRAARDEVDIRYLFSLFGDGRFTPWIAKFLFLQQEPFALGLLLAIVLVLIRARTGDFLGSPLIVLGCLSVALALVYPILFPIGCALIAAGALAAAVESRIREAVLMTLVIAVSGAAAIGHVIFLSRDRIAPLLAISEGWWLAAKGISAPIVLAPLLLGLFFAARRAPRPPLRALVVLLGGLAGSVGLYLALSLGEWRNEYKFVLSAAVCAFPFAALAFERASRTLGSRAWAVLGVVTLVLALPLVRKFAQGWPLEGLSGPPVDVRGFDLRLVSGARFAGLTDAIREQTPPTAIVVLGEDPGIHFPTVTRRKLYVPPAQEKPHPGVGEKSEDLFRIIKGYDLRIVDERRRIVRVFFHSKDDAARAGALGRILELGRPTAVVLDDERHAGLGRWLESHGGARRVYRDGDGSVWLVGADR